nr:F-box only protein 24-like isoform X1 [Ciona intestinalis]XP_026695010.1 F-box only protein 24-like isoform X2 [Ciona intestinalis]|eukprot:XP_002123036.3 F-box only protein 24-like isoform X1 [Ciona intestinalis]
MDEGAENWEQRIPIRKRKWRPIPDDAVQTSTADSGTFSRTKQIKIDPKKLRPSTLAARKSENADFNLGSLILQLPNEILGHIILHLKPRDIGRLASTCTRFHSVIDQNHLWMLLTRNHYPGWRTRSPGSELFAASIEKWKREYAVHYTKGIRYQLLGSSGTKRRTQCSITDNKSCYGYKKLCCSRDHVFALDLASCLHVYRSRWEREPITNEFVYRRADWHIEFAQNVVDVTTDPRYDNNLRRYVYVLTQSDRMKSRRSQPNTRSSPSGSVGDNPIAGDKIDVFDERTCRRVFNMTFDPEMRFVSMKLTSVTSQQKTLYILTDAGKVYSLHLFESSLLNLGSEGMQVTLKSASKTLGEKVQNVMTSVGVVGFLTESGKLHLLVQRRSEFLDIFGHEAPFRVGIPQVIRHVAKVMSCSIGDRHLGFIDEYNRAFMVGNNRKGQLGTGDRIDRSTPVQVLYGKTLRLLFCSLNHTLAVVEHGNECEMLGTGCGHNGRLPGNSRGSVDFVHLDIKIPWSVRQVDSHKESMFLLSCYDMNHHIQYKEPPNQDSSQHLQLLAMKSQQELLMDFKKASNIIEKIKVIEAMMDRFTRSEELKQTTTGQKVTFPLKQQLKVSKQVSSKPSAEKVEPSPENRCSEELRLLRHAVEQLRLEAERVELDKKIVSDQTKG